MTPNTSLICVENSSVNGAVTRSVDNSQRIKNTVDDDKSIDYIYSALSTLPTFVDMHDCCGSI